MAGVDPLLDLLAASVVAVERDGEFAGTGFWVAPGEVLTCAHVVHGGKPITVRFDAETSRPAEPISPLLAPDDPAARFYPQPDAALLRVPDAPDGHPCVRLDPSTPVVGDLLQLTAFTVGENAPDRVVRSGASLHLETLFGQDGCELFKLREGQVIGGFSGGPLLNRRTGGVCALVDSSRSPTSDLGGFGVPVPLLASIAEGLLDRNAAFHGADARWVDAVDAQVRVEAERSGERARLPLLEPVVPLEWDEGTTSPSELLRPRHAVVPFVARGDLLEQVMRWRERDTPVQVLVLAGAGGFGKSRTAIEICRAAEDAGWTAGPLDLDPDSSDGLDALLTWPGRTVLAIDYAETRPQVVTAVLKRLARRRQRAPCRVVLVIRQAAGPEVLAPLFATGDARDDIAHLLRGADWYGLGRGERELDRHALFTSASTAFAQMLGRAEVRAPDLRAEHFERPLLVTAAALLAVANPDLDVAALSTEELLTEILDRHEAVYWERTDTRRKLDLDPEDRAVAVALAALCGLHDDTADTRLVGLVPSLSDAPAARRMAVVRWLRDLYGPGGVLEPDLLAEVLVARTLTSSAGLLDAALDQALERADDPVATAQLTRTLVVASRCAGRSPATKALLRTCLDERLPRLVECVGEADAELVAAVSLTVDAASPVRGAIIAQRRVDVVGPRTGLLALQLGQLAVTGLGRVIDTRSDPDVELQSAHAAALAELSTTYSTIGRPTEGLALNEKAVTVRRALAQADPTRFLPDLARSLNNHSNLLAEVGRPVEGLATIDEAVTLRRTLVQTDPTRFLPDLASSLNNQSTLLAEAGRPTEGLAPIEEAVTTYRALAPADPTRFLPDLASSLNNRSNLLAEAGRPAEGLAPIEEAVTLRRALAHADPTRFLPDLAMSLNNQSNLLADAGRPADGLALIEEAVTTYRALAHADPTRFLPNLATALNNQSNLLADAGRPTEGLATIEESVALRRVLAQTDPTRFLPDLASSLNNQSNRLADAGRPAEGLAPIEEAVTTYRALAHADPTRFLPDLAMSLNNQSNRLVQAGRAADGLVAIEEAVTTYRALAQTDPTRFLPDLASSLNNQSNRFADAGRPAEGLALIEEAVTTYRALAHAAPTRFLPNLATALNNQSNRLAQAGRPADGLPPIREAVALRRALAEAEPTRFLPDLAMSLNNQSNLLADAGRPADGLAPIEEAVTTYRALAHADPTRFLPDLASSLKNQSEQLRRAGRAAEAARVFDLVLAEHAEPSWPRGVLLLARAQRSAASLEPTASTADAMEAVGLLGEAGDRRRRGEARQLLRALRDQDPVTVNTAWPITDALPLWLLHPSINNEIENTLIEWVQAGDWTASFDFLGAHTEQILSDLGEAGLEHLIDNNPYSTALEQHLAILRAARATDIDTVRIQLLAEVTEAGTTADLEQWIGTPTWGASTQHLTAHAETLLTDSAEEILTGLVGERPELLTYLGLLQLSRDLGVDAAHALVTDPAALSAALDAQDSDDAGSPDRRLALVRLVAGLHADIAEAHLAHSLMAAELGVTEEAVWAMQRCRDISASWERTSTERRLDEFAAAHPDVDLAPLRHALHDTPDDARP